MTATKAFKVGLIIGSTRAVRIGPQVADFIISTIKTKSQKLHSPEVTIDRIDLNEHKLPLFDEPYIPMQIKKPEDYANEHTKIWSRRIASCDAFVFVTAQRNWGIPAELKNAIDYLFNEWKGKSTILITYGGHGGLQCAEQMRQVMTGMGMKPLERMVNMAFPGSEFVGKAFKGQELGLDAGNDEGPWAEHREDIAGIFDDLVDKMESTDAA